MPSTPPPLLPIFLELLTILCIILLKIHINMSSLRRHSGISSAVIAAALYRQAADNKTATNKMLKTACANLQAFEIEPTNPSEPICNDRDFEIRGRTLCRKCHVCYARVMLKRVFVDIRSKYPTDAIGVGVERWLHKAFGMDDTLWRHEWLRVASRMDEAGVDSPVVDYLYLVDLGEYVKNTIIEYEGKKGQRDAAEDVKMVL